MSKTPLEYGSPLGARTYFGEQSAVKCAVVSGLVIIVVWYFLVGCGFWVSTNDDLRYFCDSLSGVGTAFSVLVDGSIEQKRPHIGQFPFRYLAYAANSQTVYSLVILGGLLINAIALGLLCVALTGLRSRWLVAGISLLYFLLLSNHYFHSAISFFSPVFIGSISLFCLSVYFFYSALSSASPRGRLVMRCLSLACLLGPLLTYEVFHALTPLYLVVFLLHPEFRADKRKRRELLVPLGAQALGLIVYLLIRESSPGPGYVGVEVSSHFHPSAVARTMNGFALSAFPAFQATRGEMSWMRGAFFQHSLFLQPEPYIRIWVGAISLLGCGFLLAKSTPVPLLPHAGPPTSAKTKVLSLAGATALAAYFFYVPCLLPALTEHYQRNYLDKVAIGNVTSFFSWNVLVAVCGLLLLYGLRIPNVMARTAFYSVLVVCISINSACAFVNSEVTSSIEKEGSDVIANVQRFTKSRAFRAAAASPAKANVVSEDIAKSWFSLTYDGPASLIPKPGRGDAWPERSFWEYYLNYLGNRNILYSKNVDQLAIGSDVLHIRYIRDPAQLGNAAMVVTSGTIVEDGGKRVLARTIQLFTRDPRLASLRVRVKVRNFTGLDQTYCKFASLGDGIEVTPTAPPSPDGGLYSYGFSNGQQPIGIADLESIEIIR